MKIFNDTQFNTFLLEYGQGLGHEVLGLNAGKNKQIIDVPKWLDHYDEYYTINNLKTRKAEWFYGIDKNPARINYTPLLRHSDLRRWKKTNKVCDLTAIRHPSFSNFIAGRELYYKSGF